MNNPKRVPFLISVDYGNVTYCMHELFLYFEKIQTKQKGVQINYKRDIFVSM